MAAFLNRYWAVGVEFRDKPDNLSFAREEAWKDIFVAYFPSKHVSLVGAYTELGSIAGLDDQSGWYLSLQGAFKGNNYEIIKYCVFLLLSPMVMGQNLYQQLGERRNFFNS